MKELLIEIYAADKWLCRYSRYYTRVVELIQKKKKKKKKLLNVLCAYLVCFLRYKFYIFETSNNNRVQRYSIQL